MTKLKNYISISLLSIIGNIFLLIFILLFFVLLPLSFYFETAYYSEDYYPLYSFVYITWHIFTTFTYIEPIIIPFVIIEILIYKFTKLKPLSFLQKYPNLLFIIGLISSILPFSIDILRYLSYLK